MFRVVGRDARGARHEINVSAVSEEEARATVLSAGTLVTIDQVSLPPPAPAPRFLKLSGPAVTILGCVLCLGFAVTGTVIGLWVGHEMDVSSGELIHMRFLVGSIAGAIIGVIVGVIVLVKLLRRFWTPR